MWEGLNSQTNCTYTNDENELNIKKKKKKAITIKLTIFFILLWKCNNVYRHEDFYFLFSLNKFSFEELISICD